MRQKEVVTICVCASRSLIDKEKAGRLAAILKKENYHVSLEADLCKKVMNKSADMDEIASGIIMACYPRAIHSHFHWLGLKAKQVIDIRNNSLDGILSQLQIENNENMPETEVFIEQINSFPVEDGTDAWFPVLDKDRCVECGKCHDFCSFVQVAGQKKRIFR